jgi:hypothetical protein
LRRTVQGLDGQGGEIRGRAAGHHGCIDRLRALVVGNAGVDQVDGDALDRQRAAPARLPQAQHQRGPVLCQQRLQPFLRCAERRGQLRRHHRDGRQCAGRAARALPASSG